MILQIGLSAVPSTRASFASDMRAENELLFVVLLAMDLFLVSGEPSFVSERRCITTKDIACIRSSVPVHVFPSRISLIVLLMGEIFLTANPVFFEMSAE